MGIKFTRGTRKGVQVTRKGHLRYTDTTENIRLGRAWKYVHRAVIDVLCREAPWVMQLHSEGQQEDGALWSGLIIHHMDFDKQHNCWCNLLILDTALHNGTIHEAQTRNERGEFGSVGSVGKVSTSEESDAASMPDWVTEEHEYDERERPQL